MIQKTFQKLGAVLKKDERLVTEDGKILKNQAVELANKLDEDLINLLADDRDIRKVFFKKVGEMTVFDKDLFIEFISNKEFLPDSYTAFKNKIGFESGGEYLKSKKEVVLVWPYKDCILEGGQTKEDAKRKEIFWNETLAPDDVNRLLEAKVLANWKRYDKDNTKVGHKVTQINNTDNFIIKGNNLLALHSLKKRFAGKVKLIYIDPPYNTGNDSFGYNDSFNHSTWLTFMKNRLEVARELLSNDGSIFISINHLELGYLMVLMDEIFGIENKLPIITLKAGTTASYRAINECPVNVSEYVLSYRKSSNYVANRIYRETKYSEDYSYFIKNKNDNSEKWIIEKIDDIIYKNNKCDNWKDFRNKFGSTWKNDKLKLKENFALENSDNVVSLNTLQKPSKDVRIIIEKSKNNRNKVFSYKRNNKNDIYCFNGRTLAFLSSKFKNINGKNVLAEIITNLWDDISFLSLGSEGGVDLINGKKPEALIKRIVDISTSKNDDIVLDFFAGAGTTGAVAHKIGRKYILVEQLDYIHDLPESRMKKVVEGEQGGISKAVNWKGGGSFVYTELMPVNEKFVREVEKVKSKKEVSDLWKRIEKNGFLSYRVDEEKFHKNAKDFSNLSLEEQKKFILESLNKNMLYVNINDIEDSSYKVSKEDMKLNEEFYGE